MNRHHNEPLVSVIIPNYNHSDFLECRLRSIVEQDYQNIEIIVLDDASPDNSVTVLKQFCQQEPRVTHQVYNQVNSGQPILQWIKGVQLCRGKYVWLAESDDFSAPSFLSSLVALLESDEQAGIAYCASTMVDSNDNPIGSFELFSPLYANNIWQDDFNLDGKTLLKDYFPVRNIIPNANAALFDRKLLTKHIELGRHLRLLADWLIYIHIAMECRVIYLNKALNFYRVHSTSTTRSYSIEKHRKIIKERIPIFRAIISCVGMTNLIRKAIRFMLENRHKFSRAERLFKQLVKNNVDSQSLVLYGYNDLSKYLMERDKECFTPRVIIDQGKAGNTFNDTPIAAPDDVTLSDTSTVAIMSLRYAEDMKRTLLNKGFKGKVFCV